MTPLPRRRAVAALLVAATTLAATACTSAREPRGRVPSPAADPSTPVAPVEVTAALTRATDAAAAVYAPGKPLAVNVAAFKDALVEMRRGGGGKLAVATAGSRGERPTLRLCAEAAGDVDTAAYAEQWTVIFTPDGAMTEQAVGTTCKALAPAHS